MEHYHKKQRGGRKVDRDGPERHKTKNNKGNNHNFFNGGGARGVEVMTFWGGGGQKFQNRRGGGVARVEADLGCIFKRPPFFGDGQRFCPLGFIGHAKGTQLA